ncbi:MAG: transposase family protein [Myxococcales bacterium]|nr:transposase family protein [Myxococcales bacterium]
MTAFDFEDEGLVVDVKPTWRVPRCGDCGRKVHGVHDRRQRRWRHLDLAGIKLELRYVIRRVRCPRCGVKVEQVPGPRPVAVSPSPPSARSPTWPSAPIGPRSRA